MKQLVILILLGLSLLPSMQPAPVDARSQTGPIGTTSTSTWSQRHDAGPVDAGHRRDRKKKPKHKKQPTCFGRSATVADHTGAIVGTPGNDVIIGDEGPNIVKDGGGGLDRICGNGGDDEIDLIRNTGKALIDGGPGTDFVQGPFTGDNTVLGGDGNDHVSGGQGDDVLSGGRGNDFVGGLSGNDRVSGGDGDDVVRGESGDDDLFGEAGVDRVLGGAGIDVLDGGDDRDACQQDDDTPVFSC